MAFWVLPDLSFSSLRQQCVVLPKMLSIVTALWFSQLVRAEQNTAETQVQNGREVGILKQQLCNVDNGVGKRIPPLMVEVPQKKYRAATVFA